MLGIAEFGSEFLERDSLRRSCDQKDLSTVLDVHHLETGTVTVAVLPGVCCGSGRGQRSQN